MRNPALKTVVGISDLGLDWYEQDGRPMIETRRNN
jgi:hypothetical protein